jgi:peptidoglycan hydrolase-like protein with peptidoglycan-binding domain
VPSGAPSAALRSFTSSSVLPFDLPSAASLRASPRKVWAHYWPPMTVSLDDRDATSAAGDFYAQKYLNPAANYPTGASAYGGPLRDRPMTRPPVGAGWRLADLQAEVRQAASAGLDGFTVDIMQLPGDPDVNQVTTVRTMMQAAASVDPGFKIVPQLDMGGTLQQKTPQQLASFVAELGASPAAYRLADGRLVVSAFFPETKSVDFWTSFLATLSATYGQQVAFVPTLLDETRWASAFAPISAMIGNWGSRNPAWNNPTLRYSTGPRGRIAKVHSLGVKWMQPVSVQDERPRAAVFDEAANTTNLRNTWRLARDGHAEWVQLPTWNDYTEGAHFAPSVKHGWSFLDLNAYYLTWYKTGVAPVVKRDTIYLTHRTQPWRATPTYHQTTLMRLRGGTPARNTIEALTFLTAPATVTITAGGVSTSCSAPAGQGVCTVPLRAGRVSAHATRHGTTVAAVTSPHRVTTRPTVQDLQYVAASSARQHPGGYPATAGRRVFTVAARNLPMRRGTTGHAVTTVQRAMAMVPSGRFDRATERHLRRYQRHHGLAASRVLTASTWRVLRRHPVTPPRAVRT